MKEKLLLGSRNMDPIAQLTTLFLKYIDAPTSLRIPPQMDVKLDSSGCLMFTLPGLYHLLLPSGTIDYISFRKALYKSSLNAELRLLGYQTTIQTATDHVDTTWYKLTPVD